MEITKEEIFAYTDAANKTATALEKIADRLVDISSSQKECQSKICAQLVDLVKTNQGLLQRIDKKTDDIVFLKWIMVSLMGVVAIGLIVLEIFHKFHS